MRLGNHWYCDVPAVSEFDPELLGGTVTLTAKAFRSAGCDELYSSVPYYTWGNCVENEMRVWVNVKLNLITMKSPVFPFFRKGGAVFRVLGLFP